MSGFVLKPHSTPATLLWLQANYEAVEGVCIPRNAMYNQYVEFCRVHGMMPVNAASFGKIIRQKFPGLTTRRLGTRGQSRYHYYGLAVKSDASLYAQSTFPTYGANNDIHYDTMCSDGKPAPPPSSVSRFVSSPLLRLPSSDILRGIPKCIPEASARTIHIMYTLHCQQLIDYCVHFQFKEVKEYIAHFWSGFPSHLVPLLENNSIISLIGLCDAITYRAVSHVIIPCIMLEEVPARQAEDSIRLAESILGWLVVSLSHMPLVLRRVKLHAARTLLHTIRRQVSLNHLCSNVRLVLTSDVHLQQMFTDWEHLDMQVVVDEIVFSVGTSESGYNASQIILSCCKDLEKLLRSRPQLCSLGNWVKKLVERCITRQIESSASPSTGEKLRNFACNFLLIWTSVGTRILREMTLLGAHSFGTFHLLYLMLTEFGAQLVESLILEDQIHRLTENVALGNPVDCEDFEVGILCNAQCPCKSKHAPERKQQQQHQRPETDNLSDSHLETGGMILQGMEPPYHGGVVAGHSNGDSNAEYANHNPESNQEVKIRYADNMRSIQSTNVCETAAAAATETGVYYHPHHHHQHHPPAPPPAQHAVSTRPSCSFQDPSSDGRQGTTLDHQSDSRLNPFSGRNESRLYSTSSEFTCAELTVNDQQQHDLPPGNNTSSTVNGSTHQNQNHHPHPPDSSIEYCTMDPSSSGGESGINGYNWYMISSNMSGGECYDNFYSAESTSHYLHPQQVPHHHSTVVPPQHDHPQHQHHVHQQQFH